MESLKEFWTWVYIFGSCGFVIMALIVIPLGFRDLIRMFTQLNDDHRDHQARRAAAEARDTDAAD